MMTKKEKAIELHDKKYNCAQAVACAFSGEIEVSERLLFKATEAFLGSVTTGHKRWGIPLYILNSTFLGSTITSFT